MHKFITSFLFVFLTTLSSIAQLNGDGYYRIQNFATGRYAYLADNKGKINTTATTIDLYAIHLWKGTEKASSDPSSVLYISNHGGVNHNLSGQGTDLYTIIGQYLSVRDNKDGTYLAYGTRSGLARYITDGVDDISFEQGWLIDARNGDYSKWYIKPITTNGDEYFGVLPKIDYKDKHYSSFYASFPFSFASSGMKAYYISRVEKLQDKAFAILKEAETEIIPGGTPLIIECCASKPIDNKLNIGGSEPAKYTDNMLRGAYFNNTMKDHENYVVNDKATMRILSKDAEGNLAFIVSDEKYMAANQSYLKITAGLPDNIQVMTESEFENYKQTHGITDTVISNSDKEFDVYNILGAKILSGVKSLEGLPTGIYIANGKKYIIK